MCEENEKERIISAKSRITKFTLDNEHLTKMIAELKMEISTVEATKAKLLSELEDSDPILVQDSSLSDLSDSSSSSVNSDFLVDKSSNNSDLNEYDSTSESPEDFDDSSIECKNPSISNKLDSENVPSNNLMLDCVNCVESLLSNLKVIKKCLRTDLCENCTRLKNEINTLQQFEVVSPQTSVKKDQKDSSPSNIVDIRLYDQSTSTVNNIGNGLSHLYQFFNFMSNPFLIVFICGYIGVLAYTKQANSYIVVTPPQ